MPDHRPALVVDASAVGDVLLNAAPEAVTAALRSHEVHAPGVLVAEAASVVRGHLLGGNISREQAEVALNNLQEMPVLLWEERPLLPEILSLMHNVSAYDACYVVLARRLHSSLLTVDARLARAVRELVQCHPAGAT